LQYQHNLHFSLALRWFMAFDGIQRHSMAIDGIVAFDGVMAFDGRWHSMTRWHLMALWHLMAGGIQSHHGIR